MDQGNDKPSQSAGGSYGTSSYGKRPMWQWVLLYIIVGGLVYFLIYWFFIRSSGGSSGSLY